MLRNIVFGSFTLVFLLSPYSMPVFTYKYLLFQFCIIIEFGVFVHKIYKISKS